MHPFTTRALAVAACATLIAACGDEEASTDGGPAPVRVVASTTQVGDFARQVGGDAVEVAQILRPNTDPHDYEPRPADIAAVADADLVLTSGDHIDEWMEDVVENAGGDAELVEVGEGRPVVLEGGGHEGEEHDPHWWHDPANVEFAVAVIRDAIVAVAPATRPRVEENATEYLTALDTLDEGIAACLRAVPEAQRKLVTDHDAFAYFAGRYGLEVVGAVIPAQTTQAQPSAKDLDALAEVIRREDVRAVFAESSLNPKLVKAIARQTGASAEYTLFADTLGPEGSRGATYVASEIANADAITRGLTGGERGCEIAGL